MLKLVSTTALLLAAGASAEDMAVPVVVESTQSVTEVVPVAADADADPADDVAESEEDLAAAEEEAADLRELASVVESEEEAADLRELARGSRGRMTKAKADAMRKKLGSSKDIKMAISKKMASIKAAIKKKQESRHGHADILHKSDDPVIQFMHAAKHSGFPLYYRFRGSFHGANKVSSNDKKLEGSSVGKMLGTKTVVNNRQGGSSTTNTRDNGFKRGNSWSRGSDSNFGMSNSGSAYLDASYTSDKDSLKITTDDGPKDNSNYPNSRRLDRSRGERETRNLGQKDRRGEGQKGRGDKQGSPDVDVTIKDKDKSFTIDVDGSYGSSLSVGSGSSFGRGSNNYRGNNFTTERSNKWSNKKTEKKDKQSLDAHKGDFSVDKDKEVAKQELDMKYLVEGVDPKLGMKMLDEFGDLLDSKSESD